MNDSERFWQRRSVRRRAFLGTSLLLPIPWAARLSQAQARIDVVATFSILADLIHSACGDRAKTRQLLGATGDAHTYQGNPRDAQLVSRAGLLVSNGLGLEPWLPRLLEAAQFRGLHVVASDGISPIVRSGGPYSGVPVLDPHGWQDVSGARRYLANIVAGLVSCDASNASYYRERAAAFDERLAALDTWIRGEIERVPRPKRRVIVDHDAFEYFSRAYGVEFLSARGVIPESEPSGRKMAALVTLVRAQQVRAVFLEYLGNAGLIRQIAEESGAVVGPELYTDALSPPDGPAPTYEAMMRHNVTALVAGMLAN